MVGKQLYILGKHREVQLGHLGLLQGLEQGRVINCICIHKPKSRQYEVR